MDLSIKGCSIPVCQISKHTMNKIKTDLTLTIEAYCELGEDIKFNIFHIEQEKIYLPLYYAKSLGIETINICFKDVSKLDSIGEDIIELRNKDQNDCFNIMKSIIQDRAYGGGVVNLTTGSGKCFARDTKIKTFKNKNIIYKNIQDVKIGDYVDDKETKMVDKLNTGYDYMYDVYYANGKYTVNSSHLLILYPNTPRPVIECVGLKDLYGVKDGKKSKIIVIPAGISQFYGFHLRGADKTFLIKDDILCHNTVLAIKTISETKLKSIIVCNKIDTMMYWKKELQRFIPGCRIGSIHAEEFDIDNKDIILSMLHTLTIGKNINKHIHKLNVIDLMIIDEVHTIATVKFCKLFNVLYPRYIFGLTATLDRTDGMEKIVKMYIGDVIYSNISTCKKQTTNIITHRTTYLHITEYKINNKVLNISKMLSTLVESKNRNNKIINIVLELAKNKQRNILVISDRIKHLKFLNEHIDNSGLFIGEKNTDELDRVKESSQVILATTKMVSDGFNCPRLNTLIFTTPKSNITQLIGRIYRKKHSIIPVIVDIIDTHPVYKSQFNKRKKQYEAQIDCVKYFELE